MKAFRTVTRGKYHLTSDNHISLCGSRRAFPARFDVERSGCENDVCKICTSLVAQTHTVSDVYARRQRTRDAYGRYATMFMCEVCGDAPAAYYSDEQACEVCEKCAKVDQL